MIEASASAKIRKKAQGSRHKNSEMGNQELKEIRNFQYSIFNIQ